MSGRYLLRRSLARGGMAEVFEAVAHGHSGFERRVAIKRLLPDYEAEEGFKRMFLDEARIASRLHHSSVVAVLDYGMLDGLPFQVLEFVDGKDAYTLARDATRQGHPMPTEVALYICAQVALGLQHAHVASDEGVSLGVVHRDVKPPNILISWDGDVKIADFGIAFAKERENRTVAGHVKGTPSYMAPEQQAGEGVDARTDVFSLGCVLSALVAGKSPFADAAANMRLLLGKPTELDASLPEDVRGIVARAVQRQPADRYGSAATMADALVETFAQRTRRDGKLLLLDWLRLVREATPAAPRGKLDALMDVQMVLDTEAEPRTFRASGSGATRLSNPSPDLALPLAETVADINARAPRPSRRRWGLPLLAVVALAAGAAAAGLLRVAAPMPPVPSASSQGVTTVSSTGAAPGSAVSVASAVAPPEVASTPPAASHAEVAPRMPPSHPAVSTHAGGVPGAVESTSAAASSGVMSTLAVGGGADDRGTDVIVDGTRMGMAPKYFDLPAGPHVISFHKADGRTVGPVTIELLASHTRRSPLRLTVPDE